MDKKGGGMLRRANEVSEEGPITIQWGWDMTNYPVYLYRDSTIQYGPDIY